MLKFGKPRMNFLARSAVLAFACAMASPALLAEPAGRAQAPAQSAGQEQQLSMRVNINKADADTIAQVLVGVGMSRAAAIVDYRHQHGPFASVDELSAVKGIGASTLERNRERITLK